MSAHQGILLRAKPIDTPLNLSTVVQALQTTQAADFEWVLLAAELQAELPTGTVRGLEAATNKGPLAYSTTLSELDRIGASTKILNELLFAGAPTIACTSREQCIRSIRDFSVVVYALEDWTWEVFSTSNEILGALKRRFADDPSVSIGIPEVDVEGHGTDAPQR